MKKLFLLSILLVVLFTSCNDSVKLTIDNPTKSSIEIIVDTHRIIVPSKGTVKVEIDKGEHQFIIENDSVIRFNFTESAYMINPSMSCYLISDEYYGPKVFSENFTSTIEKKEVIYLGISMKGNYDVITDVISKVTWDYGPREVLPETIDIDEGLTYTSFVKVYDSDEFRDRVLKSHKL